MAQSSHVNTRTGLAFGLGAVAVIAAVGGYMLLAEDGDVAISFEGEDTAIEKAAEALSDG
jgi:hypothetical protein